MQATHDQAHDQAFNINPEDLSTVPGVPEVVHGGCNGWNVDKGDLEKWIAIDTLVVLHPILKAAQVLLFAEQTAVLESEKLEGGHHAPIQD